MDFNETEYRAAKRAATAVARVNKGYLDAGDILGAIYEYMLKHPERILACREEGKKRMLGTVLYRAGVKYAHEERKRLTGAEDFDLCYYSIGMVEDILPKVWDYEDWFMSREGAPSTGGQSRPAEGNTKLAMLVDVSTAVFGLPVDDQELLHLRYALGHDWALVGQRFELTEDAARKRVDRIIRRLIRTLGGEPPWYDGPGKHRSNAQAQNEVRL